MAQQKVLVLGASGMLGAMVTQVLSDDSALEVAATVRDTEGGVHLKHALPQVTPLPFAVEAGRQQIIDLLKAEEPQWVVNAIGIIKPYISESSPDPVERAILVNAAFPHWLAEAASRVDARVLQIATDCVYSGKKGRYVETDSHDALDVYGKTKSLGEVRHGAVSHLRCSIIGPEFKAFRSLLEWFLRQPEKASLSGFTNHDWNGVTTYHYGKLVQGIIQGGAPAQPLQHVVPGAALTKYEMLCSFARHFGRGDLEIKAVEAQEKIDRTLSTNFGDDNARLWRQAGYAEPPSVEQMIAELAQQPLRTGAR